MLISLVIPVYNEGLGIKAFHNHLNKCLAKINQTFEIIYVDDGSSDNSAQIISKFADGNNIKLLQLSKNFGKELALTAGLFAATGQAIITIDSDNQHPPQLIEQFISKWQDGASVVVGVRRDDSKYSIRSWFGRMFYKTINMFSKVNIVPGGSDYRLIDEQVQAEFVKLSENNRITRGLIDWLGYDRQYIYFKSVERIAGKPNYSFVKLMALAKDGLVSMTPFPLYFFGIIGIIITPISFFLGIFILIEQILLNDPMGLDFTGTAMLSILIVFLVGILLLGQGVFGLYLSNIQNQVMGRSLFVIDYKKSIGFGLEKKQ